MEAVGAVRGGGVGGEGGGWGAEGVWARIGGRTHWSPVFLSTAVSGGSTGACTAVSGGSNRGCAGWGGGGAGGEGGGLRIGGVRTINVQQ